MPPILNMNASAPRALGLWIVPELLEQCSGILESLKTMEMLWNTSSFPNVDGDTHFLSSLHTILLLLIL